MMMGTVAARVVTGAAMIETTAARMTAGATTEGVMTAEVMTAEAATAAAVTTTIDCPLAIKATS